MISIDTLNESQNEINVNIPEVDHETAEFKENDVRTIEEEIIEVQVKIAHIDICPTESLLKRLNLVD